MQVGGAHGPVGVGVEEERDRVAVGGSLVGWHEVLTDTNKSFDHCLRSSPVLATSASATTGAATHSRVAQSEW